MILLPLTVISPPAFGASALAVVFFAAGFAAVVVFFAAGFAAVVFFAVAINLFF
jgi:hypothetical protein